MWRAAIGVLLLVLTAAPAVVADSQSANNAHGQQAAQTQNSVAASQATQNEQFFGLPLALAAVGGLLARAHSPVRLNVRTVTDTPAAPSKPQAAETPTTYQQQQTAAPSDGQQAATATPEPAPAPASTGAASSSEPAPQYTGTATPSDQDASVPVTWVPAPSSTAGTVISTDGAGMQGTPGTMVTADGTQVTLLQGSQASSTPGGTVTQGVLIPAGTLIQGNVMQGSVMQGNVAQGTVVQGAVFLHPSQQIPADNSPGTIISTGQLSNSTPVIPIATPQQQAWVATPTIQGSLVQAYSPGQVQSPQIVMLPSTHPGTATNQPTVVWVTKRPRNMTVINGTMGSYEGDGPDSTITVIPGSTTTTPSSSSSIAGSVVGGEGVIVSGGSYVQQQEPAVIVVNNDNAATAPDTTQMASSGTVMTGIPVSTTMPQYPSQPQVVWQHPSAVTQVRPVILQPPTMALVTPGSSSMGYAGSSKGQAAWRVPMQQQGTGPAGVQGVRMAPPGAMRRRRMGGQ